jgi:hypothetical protein
VSPAELHRLHLGYFGLPPRLNDCVERFKLNRRITDMVSAMARAETSNTDFLQEQLHTLPGCRAGQKSASLKCSMTKENPFHVIQRGVRRRMTM